MASTVLHPLELAPHPPSGEHGVEIIALHARALTRRSSFVFYANRELADALASLGSPVRFGAWPSMTWVRAARGSPRLTV